MDQRNKKIVVSAKIAAGQQDKMDKQIEKQMVSHERELKRLEGFAPLAFSLLTQDQKEFSAARKEGVTAQAMDQALRLVLHRPFFAHGSASLLNAHTITVTIEQIAQALGMRPSVMLPDLRCHIVQYLLREGWVRQKKQINLVRAYLYVRPAQ